MSVEFTMSTTLGELQQVLSTKGLFIQKMETHPSHVGKWKCCLLSEKTLRVFAALGDNIPEAITNAIAKAEQAR